MSQLERLPYFKCYPADYLLDTRPLTMAQDGAYCLLMMNYYWDGSLPPKPAIYRLCKAQTPSERADVDFVLSGYFVETDGRYTHARIEREREKLGAMVRSKQRGGQAASAKRWADHEKKTPERKPRGNGHDHHDKEPPVLAPDWLDVPKWNAWMEIRPAKARTPAAKRAALEKLEAFRAAGHDANAIIANSLANGWQGLFPPDGAAKPAKFDPFNPGPGKAVM